jgi:chitinase
MTFDASASVAYGGIIVSYRWNFGDGNITTVTVPIIYHTYQSAGNYTVTLQVTNSAGYSSSIPKSVQVGPIANPTASFTWSPTIPRTNQTVAFNAAASTPGWNGSTYPSIIYYVWNFGDGNITSTMNPIVYHKYSSRGNYTVTMTVMDAQGRTDDITQTVTVSGLIGDVNGDGKIDMKDIARVAKHFGEHVGDPAWDPVCDINGDGKVDMKDISYVAKLFGQQL